MTTGTAVLLLGLIGLFLASHPFRMVSLGAIGLFGGALVWAMVYGADKPQTFFYNQADHPAFAMHPGRICPPDRHIWNGWCVK